MKTQNNFKKLIRKSQFILPCQCTELSALTWKEITVAYENIYIYMQ